MDLSTSDWTAKIADDRGIIRAAMMARKKKMARYLSEEAFRRGTTDNVTVQIVRTVSGQGPRALVHVVLFCFSWVECLLWLWSQLTASLPVLCSYIDRFGCNEAVVFMLDYMV